jgi:hypothetical protein
MFGALKSAWRGRSAGGDEAKDAAHAQPRSQPKSFFADGTRTLVNHYTVYIEERGDYVEK